MADRRNHDSAGIEVVHELPNNLPSSLNAGTKAELASQFGGDGVDQSIPAPAAGPPLRRVNRTIVWLVVTIILLVVLAVVLGTVLGTKLHSKSAAPSTTSASSLAATPTSSPTASPSTVRKNTAISVTGYRNGPEFSIRLFYQGNDAYLRIIGFESGNSSWSAPSTILQAKLGTPIAAASYNNNAFFGTSTV